MDEKARSRFRKELSRVSEGSKKILELIESSNWTVGYKNEVVPKLRFLIFKENFDEYLLSQDEWDLYYWIINDHNLAIEVQQYNYNRKNPVYNFDPNNMPTKESEQEKNYTNLQSIAITLNTFLKRAKNCAKTA